MEKNIVLSANKSINPSSATSKSISERIASTKIIQTVANVMTDIMDEHIDGQQALAILNVILALCMAVFPVMPLIGRVVCLMWLIASGMQCKDKGISLWDE